MITGTSKNYVGRKVDLSLFPEIAFSGIPVTAGISDSPKVIAGPSAAAQNFVRILLTKKGTYLADPEMGTLFFDKIATRLIRFPSDIQHAFLIESAQVLDYLVEKREADTPLDEQIKKATLVDQTVGSTTVDLTIEIETRGGDKVSFLLPINWNL